MHRIWQATYCSSVPEDWIAEIGSVWKLLIFLSCAFPSLCLVIAAKERSKSPENSSGNHVRWVYSFDFLSSDSQVTKSFLSDQNLMSWHFKVISLSSRDGSPRFLLNLLSGCDRCWGVSCVLEVTTADLASLALSQRSWEIADSSCPFRGTELFQWQNK